MSIYLRTASGGAARPTEVGLAIPQLDLAAFEALAKLPGVTAVDFTAAWCAPCKAMEPILVALGKEYTNRVRVVAIDVHAEPLLAERYNVRAMPTLVLLRDGREVGRTVGSRNRGFLAGMFDRALHGDVAIAAP